jgi:hypothetical protein
MPRGVKRAHDAGVCLPYVLRLCVWLRGGCVDGVCVRRVAQMVATTRWLALVMTVRV